MCSPSAGVVLKALYLFISVRTSNKLFKREVPLIGGFDAFIVGKVIKASNKVIWRYGNEVTFAWALDTQSKVLDKPKMSIYSVLD